MNVLTSWLFGWLSGEARVPASVQLVPSVVRWTRNDVSVIELSFQVTTILRLFPLPVNEKASPSGLYGGSASDCGRIMSISSWLRMWQCQTYSQPKLTSWLVIGLVGLPCGSMLLNVHRRARRASSG